jgi:hypothetical protein
MLTVNEKSPVQMTMVFTDFDGSPLIPTTVEWRLDNRTEDTQIVDWTALGSPASTMTVTVPGSNNVIADDTHAREVMIFGVRLDSGLAGEAHSQHAYNVKNLKGPSGP